LHSGQTSHPIRFASSKELAAWLADQAKCSGVPHGKIIGDQLEAARASGGSSKRFMRLAGGTRPRRPRGRQGMLAFVEGIL
jgi:hypothetical protein